jgi:hypothetical protein
VKTDIYKPKHPATKSSYHFPGLFVVITRITVTVRAPTAASTTCLVTVDVHAPTLRVKVTVTAVDRRLTNIEKRVTMTVCAWFTVLMRKIVTFVSSGVTMIVRARVIANI